MRSGSIWPARIRRARPSAPARHVYRPCHSRGLISGAWGRYILAAESAASLDAWLRTLQNCSEFDSRSLLFSEQSAASAQAASEAAAAELAAAETAAHSSGQVPAPPGCLPAGTPTFGRGQDRVPTAPRRTARAWRRS
jgi:hypothetical protein